MLHIVGTCEQRLFGLLPEERLKRQLADSVRDDLVLVAKAGLVVNDLTLAWLFENPRTMLVSESGNRLAVAVERSALPIASATLAGEADAYPAMNCNAVGDHFVRKLRRRSQLLALDLTETGTWPAEWRLFKDVYKGVTDIVTKWAWPVPAFCVTHIFSRCGITPNMVTFASLVLTFTAAWWFAGAEFLIGMPMAWLMTFFDTVDGKLARVTVRSSRLGNFFDHSIDILHPPAWWFCLARGLSLIDPENSDVIWLCCWIILGGYAAGRVVEINFKLMIGYNAFLWRRFDSVFRLVLSRRNIILLIMSAGFLLGNATMAWITCMIWTVISVIVQAVRLGQAMVVKKAGPVVSWMM